MAFLAKDGFKTNGNLNYHSGYKPTATDIGIASTAQAVAGTDNATIMTPLRVKEYVANLGYSSTGHNHDSSYLGLSGGVLTGDLSIQKALPIFTIKNTSGTDVEIVLDRSSNANWKIVNSSGILSFQTDYADTKGSSYYPALKLSYNTGNLWVKGSISENGVSLASKYAPLSHTHTVAQVSGLSAVASSGDYNDLSNKPVIINDAATVTTQTWSSSQINSAIDTRVTNLIGTAPAALDTLKELADALGNDPSFATTVTTELGLKATTTYVNTELAKKASTAVATQAVNGLMSSTDKKKLDGVAAGAMPNQNAFSNVKVGTSTVTAKSATGTVELVAGTGITLTANATTDQITVSGVNQYTHPTGDGNNHVPANGTTNAGTYLQATGTAGTYQWASLPNASTSVAGIVQLGTGASNAAAGNHGHSYLPLSGGSVSGTTNFNTNTDTTPLIISRLGGLAESLKIGLHDAYTKFLYTNDETAGVIDFIIDNTDTETGGGVNANTTTFSIRGSKTPSITFNGNKVYHAGDKPTWADIGAAAATHTHDYAASTHTHSYLPLSGGTMSDNATPITLVRSSSPNLNICFQNTTTGSVGTKYLGTYQGTSLRFGNSADLSSGYEIYHAGNKPSAADIGAAEASHTHNYLPVSGGTLTGRMTTMANQYFVDSKAGINMNNSDIIGANCIVFADEADAVEGLLFPKSGKVGSSILTSDYDVIKSYQSYFYYNNNKIYHEGFKPSPADIGAAAASHTHSYASTTHTHSYLPLSGGTLTGRLLNTASGRIATFGDAGANVPSSAIANQNNFIEIASGAGATSSSALVFHHTGVSTNALEYVNTTESAGYFNFKSDDLNWNVRVNNNPIYHEGNKPSAIDIGALNYQEQATGTSLDTSFETGTHWIFHATGTLPTGYTSDNDFVLQAFRSGKANKSWQIQTLFDMRSDKIFLRRQDSGTFGSWKRIYNEGNKPSLTELGAAAALITTNGHSGLTHNDGSDVEWMRTTVNGLIPYRSGGASSLGTSAWPFSAVYSNSYALRGTNLEDFIPMQIGESGNLINRLPKSGFYEKNAATTAEGYPITPPNGWMHLINCQHSNTVNNYALQIAASFYENRFFMRCTNGSGSAKWSELSVGKDSVNFGNNQNYITTADFITLLRNEGAFQTHHWVSRGSWYYAGNQIISDTNLGYIHLAGCTIEKIGFEPAYTIRIMTPSTGGGFNRAEFIYINNGSIYSPGWHRNLSVTTVPNQEGAFDNTGGTPTGTTRLNYSGYFYATRNYNAVWNDYAEYFEKQDTEDQDFEPGDVIASINDKYVKSTCAYQETVIGVYSDSFGHIVGGTGDQEKDEKECIPVGLSGRVYVKIIGKIKNGQLLTSSDIPGVAMYAAEYKPGVIIGKAVEDKDTEELGKVKMLIMNA